MGGSLKNAARKCCVDVNFPRKLAFPITTVIGSKQGIQKFHEALQYYLQKPVLRKFSQKEHTLCKRCDMTFPAFHGSSIKSKTGPINVTLQKHDAASYPWGGHWSDDLRITRLDDDGIWEGLGLEEGMTISDLKPSKEAFLKGEACTFTAQHECGFVCRFCWPAMQKQNKAFVRSKRNRIAVKEQKAKAQAARALRAEAILAKAKQNLGRLTKLPASYLTLRAAKVRQGRSLESEEVGIVPRCEVMVVEVVENRARISSPMKGWVSI